MPRVSTESQVSAGGVIYRAQGGNIEVALIGVGSPLRWQLPKGLVDPGESFEAAALREVREETGILGTILAPITQIEYWYYGKKETQKVRFHKTVHYYLLRAESGDVADHDREVEEARWVELNQASGLLAFKNEKQVLDRARELIRPLC